MGQQQETNVQEAITNEPAAATPATPPPQGARYVDANAPSPAAVATPTPPESVKTPEPPPEPPATAGDQVLEGEALKARLEREHKKALKDAWGTDDPDRIEALKTERETEKKELERLKRIEKSRERARMTNAERERLAVAEKDKEIEELRTQVTTMRTDAAVEKQDLLINESASKLIRPARLKYARRELADHLNKLAETSPEKFKEFGQRSLEKFFSDLAKNDPDFAIPAAPGEAASPAATKPKPRVKKPTTGKTKASDKLPAQDADGPGLFGGKTVKPGFANSMDKKELAAYYKQRGMRSPY